MQQASEVATFHEADRITSSVLSSLLYFSVFNHPLTAEEIVENNNIPNVSLNDITSCLNELTLKGMIYRIDQFYAISADPTFIQRRIKGNHLAQVYLKRAKTVSRIISWFPFVRCIMISGSLSKGYMDKGSDIDYFIVTEKGRLWFCRSLLAILRKLMIGPFRKYFCINYFIDTSSLAIPDHNIFTATEIAFVYPTYGSAVYNDFINANSWIQNHYPNKKVTYTSTNDNSYSLKAIIEKIFSGKLGESMDSFLFRFMLTRWKKRYSAFDESEFDLNIRTKKNVSKQHEKGYQFIVLKKYEEQLSNFEYLHQVKIQHG
jgi:hypothetical protein